MDVGEQAELGLPGAGELGAWGQGPEAEIRAEWAGDGDRGLNAELLVWSPSGSEA